MVKNFRARPIGWRGESHRHYLASKGISTRRYNADLGFDMTMFHTSSKPGGEGVDHEYFSKSSKQKLPDFLLSNNLQNVRRPRLKDASYLRRSGDSGVPTKHRLELLKIGDKVDITLRKSKDDVTLSIVAVDAWSDLHVGEVVSSSGSEANVGDKIFFHRNNVRALA